MANLVTLPPPHGSPHPTTHLTTYLYVFCVQRAQKPCLMIKIQLLLHFSKVGGGKSILAFFGLWWPSFSATGSPGVAQKCQTRVSPCYTYGNPCQNICRACSINFMQFLNTPPHHRSSVSAAAAAVLDCLRYLNEGQGSESRMGIEVTQEFKGAL